LGGKKKEKKQSRMAGGKLLMILAMLAMAATSLVVATQAQATELDGLEQVSVRTKWGHCDKYLTGEGPMVNYCRILYILHTKKRQCFVMESIANEYPSVDRQAARELPKKCGTLKEVCSFSVTMMPLDVNYVTSCWRDRVECHICMLVA